MNLFNRWLPSILVALMIVFLSALWISLAPVQLGGQVAYVIISGNSMEPSFHTGDLVIVQKTLTFKIGDIAAYNNTELRHIVFHRIIGKELDRFIFKGDHNTWVDSYRPLKQELIGKLWIHFPMIGKAIQWARLPINFTIISTLIGGIFMGTLLMEKSSNKSEKTNSIKIFFESAKIWLFNKFLSGRESTHMVVYPEISPEINLNSTSQNKIDERGLLYNRKHTEGIWSAFDESLFFGLCILGLGSLLVGFFAFTRPTLRTVQDDISYQQIGIFSYSGSASPGIYDSESIKPMDPIFQNLTCIMNTSFSYVLIGEKPEGLAGTQQMFAEISDETSGWKRTVPLTRASTFLGNSSNVKTDVNLCELEALTKTMEEATNYVAPYYILRILPRITISGKLLQRNLQDTFKPSLTFQFDKLHTYIVKSELNSDPLTSVTAGLITGTRIEPNTIPILGFEPEVGKLRLVALIGFILALAGLIFIIKIINRLAIDKVAYIRLKYNSTILDVNNGDLEQDGKIIDLNTLDDLARLADRKNLMILHKSKNPLHYYYLQGDGITYRFILNKEGDISIESADYQLKEELGSDFGGGK